MNILERINGYLNEARGITVSVITGRDGSQVIMTPVPVSPADMKKLIADVAGIVGAAPQLFNIKNGQVNLNDVWQSAIIEKTSAYKIIEQEAAKVGETDHIVRELIPYVFKKGAPWIAKIEKGMSDMVTAVQLRAHLNKY